MSYQSEVLSDSPVAYWRLGDSGTVAEDEVATLDGTYTGTYSHVDGVLPGNGALSLSATADSFVTMGDTTIVDGASTLSIECFVKPVSAAAAYVFVSKQAAGGQSFSVQQGGSGGVLMSAGSGGSVVLQTAAALPTTTFTHVVAVYDSADGSAGRIYYNGVSQTLTTQTTNGTIPNTTANLKIGAQDWATFERYLNGVVDEVALYPTALSAARVLAHYAAAFAATGDTMLVMGRIRSRRTSW